MEQDKEKEKPELQYTSQEIEQKIRELSPENIDFVINVNNIIGNLGPKNFHAAINAISTALFILQKENSLRHTVNITLLANKILMSQSAQAHEFDRMQLFTLNRAQIICLLYYIQQNIETIHMILGNELDEVPTWSIREDIFKSLCNDQLLI